MMVSISVSMASLSLPEFSGLASFKPISSSSSSPSTSCRVVLNIPLRIEAREPTRKETVKVGHRRIRKKLNGTSETPRLAVFCSNKQLHAQVTHDSKQHTLDSSSTLKKTLREDLQMSSGPTIGNLSAPRTLYLVDVHPLCYEGKKPRPTALLNWMDLLFNQVSLTEPVIAVMDGERGNDYRKGLLPTYKEKRNKYKPLSGIRGPYFKGDEMDLRDAFPHIKSFLIDCNVPVIKVEDAEADDVIATLMRQAVNKGMKVVLASPDMDYRQLLSHSVEMVLPLPEFGRWSFYTLQRYVAEHDCDPSIDLGLRCMLGDQSDNVPGLQEWATGFGRKTALKLMKKHGSLENLLLASQTRTVGKPYIQEALAKYRDALHRNLQVLSLRRDLDVTLKDEWLRPRDRSNEAQGFRQLQQVLQGNRSYSK